MREEVFRQRLADLLHWTWSSSLQLDRYLDALSTEWSRAAAAADSRKAFSRTSLEEHLLVVTLRHLLEASDRAGSRFPSLGVEPRSRDALKLLRDAYEHWATEQPAYARGVKKQSGAVAELAKVDPSARPWLVKLTETGPVLAGTIPLRDIRGALEDLEAELLRLEKASSREVD